MKGYLIPAFLLSLFAHHAFAEKVYFTSLEWPPYSGASLPDQGATIAVAKAALAAMGHELVVDFFPWTRAVKLVQQSDSKYLAYLPEYKYETTDFIFSNSLGQGPLGIVENQDKKIAWETIDDLTKFKIGVVQDYVNTTEFDEKVAAGTLKVEAVTSDAQNIQKVAAGRLDAAVIDSNVLHFLLTNEKSLASAASNVAMNERLLETKDLYAAFKNTEDGAKWLAILNEGLTKIDVDAIAGEHLR